MNKIKLTLLSLSVLFGGMNLNAQAFQQGKNFVSLSYGLKLVTPESFLRALDPDLPIGLKFTNIGPIGLKYEYAVAEDVGIGVSLGYSSFNVSYSEQVIEGSSVNEYYYTVKGSKFTGSARINWHFGEHDIIDPYLGLGLGFKARTTKYESNDLGETTGVFFPLLFPVSFEATFGTRFLFSDNLGAFVELGIGHGVLQAGLVGKF